MGKKSTAFSDIFARVPRRGTAFEGAEKEKEKREKELRSNRY